VPRHTEGNRFPHLAGVPRHTEGNRFPHLAGVPRHTEGNRFPQLAGVGRHAEGKRASLFELSCNRGLKDRASKNEICEFKEVFFHNSENVVSDFVFDSSKIPRFEIKQRYFWLLEPIDLQNRDSVRLNEMRAAAAYRQRWHPASYRANRAGRSGRKFHHRDTARRRRNQIVLVLVGVRRGLA
jgi:hypothetical protein